MASLAIALTSMPAMAAESTDGSAPAPETAWEAHRTVSTTEKITTGVAKARDRLNSATSTSVIEENEIVRIGAASLPELARNIPGIRAEAGQGEENGNYTIRGLPMASTGAKYLQFQEDGLPVLEFGDILVSVPDMFMRLDYNVSSVESIRGGSSSTFASNAPGGVVNLLSKTGDVEGGSVGINSGLGTGTSRVDAEVGGRLGEGWRYHIGGFYRTGEGPYNVGSDVYRGGQVKFNVTRELADGYIRLYAKFLDDRVPSIPSGYIGVTGTDSNPDYSALPGFSLKSDTLASRYTFGETLANGNFAYRTGGVPRGTRSKDKSIGLEAKFDIAGWTVTERLRYSSKSGYYSDHYPVGTFDAASFAALYGGASLAYANGPMAGQVIADPASLNGNGLLALDQASYNHLDDLSSFVNDIRASRVYDVSGGDLTLTAGLYKSRQTIAYGYEVGQYLQTLAGNGQSVLVDVLDGGGDALTATGYIGNFPFDAMRFQMDADYDITAPYGSVNFHKGKLALGASIRYDRMKANGTAAWFSAMVPVDVNGDGIIAPAETALPLVTANDFFPIDYKTDYLSYSVSANYRVQENLSVFARYSRGSRAAADRLLLSSALLDPATGGLSGGYKGYDPVKQAETGVKFREGDLTLNLTAFWAKAEETNSQLTDGNAVLIVSNGYRALGLEFEGAFRKGAFSIKAGATYTDAKIVHSDRAEIEGNTPLHQPKIIYQITPAYDIDLFTLGANIVGTGSSYTQDDNVLKMPAYTTVGLFAQARPAKNLELSFNVYNLFDTLALTSVLDSAMPASGVAIARSLPGRTYTLSARVFF